MNKGVAMTQHEITYHAAFPVLKVQMPPNGTLKANGNALVAMADSVQLTGKMEGGVLGSLWRSFSGESFFLQRYEASEKGGWVWLGPDLPGAIQHLPVDGGEWLVTRGGFLAGSAGIEVSTKLQNLMRGMFSGEGLFVVRLSGTGDVFLSSFGGIEVLDLAPGESVVVDFGRLVAWPAGMKFDVTVPAKGLWSGVITGEILACRMTGPGRVYLQTLSNTHFAAATAAMVQPFMRVPSK
jgi:uncharacterized protein (TIGR00266 family)